MARFVGSTLSTDDNAQMTLTIEPVCNMGRSCRLDCPIVDRTTPRSVTMRCRWRNQTGNTRTSVEHFGMPEALHWL